MAVNFALRPAKSVVFVATIRPSEPPPAHRIEPGDDVKLYVDRIEVFVKVTEAVTTSAFSGRILGTNGHGATLGPDLANGAVVTFTEHQIFTCSKRR